MKKKWLHKIIEKLNRSDGSAIIAFIAMMLVMTIMGGAFASIIGGWRMSSPYEINSNRAAQLANSAATFALQEAQNKITAADPLDPVDYGTRLFQILVFDDGDDGFAEYWIERPDLPNDDDVNLPGDDEVDDDDDDGTDPTLYTIIATGRVENVAGNTVARRQVKIFVDNLTF